MPLAARTSETSVDIYLTTRQYIPEDSELHTRCLENLKCHIALICYHGLKNIAEMSVTLATITLKGTSKRKTKET
jgi:hypothetical protein